MKAGVNVTSQSSIAQRHNGVNARTLAQRLTCTVAFILLHTLTAAVSTPVITPSMTSPVPVGTRVTFTASSTDSDAGLIRYRYRVRPAGGTFTTVYDFGPSNRLDWVPTETDGLFEIEATAKNHTTTTTAASSVLYTISPALNGGAPAVHATAHPLVALYSGVVCPSGSTMRVRFKLLTDITWQASALKSCNGSTTMNFLVGGMRANSTYEMRQDVFTGPRVITGPSLTFTTGSIAVSIPAVTSIQPIVSPGSTTEGVTLFFPLSQLAGFAVDATGAVIWYSPVPGVYSTRPVSGGTFLQLFGFTKDLANSGFVEIDLAGNTIRCTNIERMNEQLAAAGKHPVTTFHHEVRRLTNGNYMMLAMTERTNDIQGPNLDIAGDMILVLDSNLQLLWAWDSFDHLDVSRKAVLGETCSIGPAACVLFNSIRANDWTHGNCAALTPDGNILYSARHQDLVFKIAYGNGSGDGHVIWRLGKDGDFTWQSNDPWPWQSHQHDAEYESANLVSLYDNGNTRVQLLGGHSRGQSLLFDEINRTVTPQLNADLGVYSSALGSAQLLINGNLAFNSGIITGNHTEASEIGPNGMTSLLSAPVVTYRSFRLRDLYSAK